MVKCDFCGKEYEDDEVVMGVNTAICPDCLILSFELLPENKREGVAFHPESVETKSSDAPSEKLLLKPKELKAKLDEYVMGQEEAKRLLVTEIYTHLKAQQLGMERRKNNICLIGPSGCGKTYVVEQLARLLDIPFVLEDATSLTKTGYVGNSASGIIERLYQAAGGNLERAQRGIVFIDEIDKLSANFNTSSGKGDVGTTGVQQELLKLIEGTTVELSVEHYFSQKNVLFNTHEVLFIVGGAFVGLTEEKRLKEKGQHKIGFQSEHPTEVATTTTTTHEDLITYKLMPELVGRLSMLIDLNALSENELRDVLLTSKDSILTTYQTMFALEGLTLEFTENAIGFLVKEAKKSSIGVRGLKGVLSKTLNHLLYDALLDDEEKVIRVDEKHFAPTLAIQHAN